MCLAVPARIVERRDDADAVADLHGNRVAVSTLLTPDVAVGDWVLVHAGFAIQQLSDDDVAATWKALEGVAAAAKGRTP